VNGSNGGIIVQISQISNTLNLATDESVLNSGLSCQEKLAEELMNKQDPNVFQMPQAIEKQDSKSLKKVK
jgi:hypothetical protein